MSQPSNSIEIKVIAEPQDLILDFDRNTEISINQKNQILRKKKFVGSILDWDNSDYKKQLYEDFSKGYRFCGQYIYEIYKNYKLIYTHVADRKLRDNEVIDEVIYLLKHKMPHTEKIMSEINEYYKTTKGRKTVDFKNSSL